MSKHNRKQIIQALNLTYDKVWADLKWQMNAYSFLKRAKLAWLILWGKL